MRMIYVAYETSEGYIYIECKLISSLLEGECVIQWVLVGDKFLKYHMVLS